MEPTAYRRRRRPEPRHRTTITTPDQELTRAARAIATFLADVAHHHGDDQNTVHLVAVGAPGQPAVLVVGTDVIAHAADLLRSTPIEAT